MDFRKSRVLQAVINDYITTAEPVGSRTIARKYNLGVSSATIRNEMADLEELGYLEQPHTSAGRVPSDKGYRYYVDNLMEAACVSEESLRKMHAILSRRSHEVAFLLQQAARLLAEVTGYMVLLSGPEVACSICQYVQILPLRESRISLVVVTADGFLHSRILEFDGPVTPDEMRFLSWSLTEHFRGQSLESIAHGVLPGREEGFSAVQSILTRAVEALREELEPDSRERVYMGGATNLLRQPEFRDVRKASTLLSALEEERLAQELLRRWGTEWQRASVAIGGELDAEAIQDCSLVAAGYRVGDRLAGRIGVLGPRRMDYARVMALVDEITRSLSLILTEGPA